MSFIKREIEKNLLKATKQFSAVILTGARQVGKSTLVRELFPNYGYVSLDEIDTRTYAQDDPRGFLKSHPTPLIIDEIQEAPELLNYVKKIIDDNRSKTGLFIITGSQQFSLMEGVQESLAGRAAVLELHSFSMHELKEAGKIKEQDWSWIVERGSYPELWLKKSMNLQLWYSSYIKTFLERDIKANLQKNYLKHYEQFLNLVIARCGQELNYADIAKDLGVDEKTVKSWLAFLERSQIIFLLEPYPKKIEKKQVSKKPKIYFYDTGLIAHRLGYRTNEQIKKSPISGALFENLVISELIKRHKANLESGFFYHFREKNGLEIDLIYENRTEIKLMEIKQNETPNINFAKNLLKFTELSPKVSKQFLLSPHSKDFEQNSVEFINYQNFYNSGELR